VTYSVRAVSNHPRHDIARAVTVKNAAKSVVTCTVTVTAELSCGVFTDYIGPFTKTHH